MPQKEYANTKNNIIYKIKIKSECLHIVIYALWWHFLCFKIALFNLNKYFCKK